MSEFSISNLDEELKEFYNNSNPAYRHIIENIFNEDVKTYSSAERPIPPYAPGTLDKPFLQGGIPIQPKAKSLFNAVLSGNYSTIEVEGGVRGGKDIYALLAWARKLQVTPDTMHLALGDSLEHVLKTVLMSNGFGLYFLIPHGVFVRESINGAQRGVYKFLDNYGQEKQVLFYGNKKENDSDKFQGFTIGTVYVNEALNQHVRGLNQAEDRMASVASPMMITTQNPKGKAHAFYMEFERPKLINMEEIVRLEKLRDTYKDVFTEFEEEKKSERNQLRKVFIRDFLTKKGVAKYQELSVRDQVYLNKRLLDINYMFDKIIRNAPAQDFDTSLREGDYAFNKSMKKIVDYERGGDNPNNVYNAYDFYYQHFTVDDNLAMTEMQRLDFKGKRAKGTSIYDQHVLGMRRSTDSAVFSMFTQENNVFGGDILQFDHGKTERVIAIDKGLSHPSGIVDVEIDFDTGTVYQLQECLLDVKKDDVEDKGLETVYIELLRVIRGRKNRKMPISVLVDPSSPELIAYLSQRNIPVRKASNAVWSARGEKEEAHQLVDKGLIGIPLMQTAIAKGKVKIHENCIYTIDQIGSYEAPFDEKTGRDKVKKVYDDLVDPLRYILNTYIRVGMWEGEMPSAEERQAEDDESGIYGDESTERGKWDLERDLAETLYGEQAVADDFDGFGDFWNTDGNGGFFGN
jgi:hypothetical protein